MVYLREGLNKGYRLERGLKIKSILIFIYYRIIKEHSLEFIVSRLGLQGIIILIKIVVVEKCQSPVLAKPRILGRIQS